MNFSRITANVNAAFDAAVQYADSKGFLSTDENGNLRLSESGSEYAEKFNG